MIGPRGEAQKNDSAARERAAATGPDTPGRKQDKLPPRSMWMTFFVIVVLNYLVMPLFFPSPDAPVTVPYTVFKEEVSKGNVTSIYAKGERIEARFGAAVTWPAAGEKNRRRRGTGRYGPLTPSTGAPYAAGFDLPPHRERGP